MGRHAASRPGRLRPQHNTEDISLRNIEENTVPKREDKQSQGVGYRLLQLFAGMSIFLAIILVMHVGWVYIGNGMDQIHTQQTIVTNQGFKTAQPTKTDGSTRIAKPQTGEPPTEPEPEYSTVIGWMRIPRFGTEWQRAIQEGTDLKVLDNYGIGHYQGTVMPGSIGNSSYAGHRTPGDLGPADTLKPGDPIIIQTADHWYVYEMQSSWMTTPDDAAVIADQTDQKDARLITLTTCKYSLDEQDSLSARLIVRGRFKYWANTADGIPQELAPQTINSHTTGKSHHRTQYPKSQQIRSSQPTPVHRNTNNLVHPHRPVMAHLAQRPPEENNIMEPHDTNLAHPIRPNHPTRNHLPILLGNATIRRMGMDQPTTFPTNPTIHRHRHPKLKTSGNTQNPYANNNR